MARILIVDDERSIRTTLAEFIREDGHDVYTAEDATQALALLDEKKPAIVVTDIILPRMTGVSLLKRINEIAPNVQVIMITGEPTAETAAEAVRLGAFDYLSKPIARTDFKSAVTSALRVSEIAMERSRLEEENTRYREHLEEEVAKATAALRASEEKYRAVVEHASEALFVIQDGVIPFANPSASNLSGRSPEELRATPFVEWLHPDDRELAIERYIHRVSGKDAPSSYEYRIVRPDGDIRIVEFKIVLINWEGKPATLNFASDITDRKLREATEASRQQRIQQQDSALVALAMDSVLYEGSMQEAIQIITEASAQTLIVERVSVWLSAGDKDVFECIDLYQRTQDLHSAEDVLSRRDYPNYFHALEENRVIAADDVRQDPRTYDYTEAYLNELGITSILDVPIRVEGELIGVVCHEHAGDPRTWEQEDINFAISIAGLISLAIEAGHRRQAEHEREQSEIRYRNLFENSPISLWEEDLSAARALLEEIENRGIEDMESYLLKHPEIVMACIQSIRVVDVNQAAVALHQAESKEELFESLLQVIPPHRAEQFIPQLMAIQEGRTLYEGTAINQRLDGSEFHAALRWIPAPGFEATLERVLLSKIDITANVEAEESLRQALDGTIRAIGMTTETRDPYTAGHQRRVTELAVAIANRLQLDPQIIEGTRIAGLMHDIGKLAIPAEILSKPSALSKMEYALIHSHPQAAYDILETITFPWPISQIVLQHHERMDGSGYPNGLGGDDIRIEARILAVADTVEAMASHRPYRPALGIDLALEEIEKSRGSKFDPVIVDTCLELFRQGDFAFSDRKDGQA